MNNTENPRIKILEDQNKLHVDEIHKKVKALNETISENEQLRLVLEAIISGDGIKTLDDAKELSKKVLKKYKYM
ncbi:hypothetical protein CN918_30985 [Priestia megaterium]|nr:hypothetical protein CN918_30985 [Priestia megaterium]